MVQLLMQQNICFVNDFKKLKEIRIEFSQEARVKGAEATCLEIATKTKKILDWKTFPISMFSEIFSPYKLVAADYLGNKKPTFLACNPK